MRKAIAILFMLAGFIIIGFAGYEIYQTNAQQQEALDTAIELVFSDNEKEYEEVLEDFDPGQGDIVGILTIPRLSADLPIVEGTHEDDLARGVGHYVGTGFPTDNRQILLSGHRDTVFRNLGELEIGDVFEVKMNYGTFTYEIYETFIVDADDTTVIDFSIDEEVLTVSTCYPFRFVGNAPERYILNAKPVTSD
ncbi:class D sortase [Evansella tamaricis]|uniref:Class D sortase n=1 Tax=Evansella tamaricis TaxID=2069301 RepID=A0ABS6JMP5_9BACI|nr:class D sortase [Evansella tamaricis]MBU9714943.1 class D sortase [Evansella tamaricis]